MVVVPQGPVNVATTLPTLGCVTFITSVIFDAAVIAPAGKVIDVLTPVGLLSGIATVVLLLPEITPLLPNELAALNVTLEPRHIVEVAGVNTTVGFGLTVTVVDPVRSLAWLG